MSSNVTDDQRATQKLPRGRHNLSREEVLASQRSRLIAAMLDLVEAHGYGGTTVSDVVGTAHVSRNAFYELFDDRQDCFIAACDELQSALLDSLYEQMTRPTWLEALERGLDIYLEFWTARPGFAIVYVVEFPIAGKRALEQRDRAYERFARMFQALGARARVEQPDLPPLPKLNTRILVTAITELLAQEVRSGRGDKLVELRDDMLRFIVLMLADEATAKRALAGG